MVRNSFILCKDGKTPKESASAIRKHAMTVVSGKRRTKGADNPSRRTNRLQLPPDILTAHKKHATAIEDAEEEISPVIVQSVPLSGLFKLMATLSFELCDLSAFTTIHVGGSASSIISTNPRKFTHLMTKRQSSFLEHVYARFDHVQVLHDAVICLLWKAHQMLSRSRQHEWGKFCTRQQILRYYGRAVTALRGALSNGEWNSPEVLCAIKLLAIYEVCLEPVMKIEFHR